MENIFIKDTADDGFKTATKKCREESSKNSNLSKIADVLNSPKYSDMESENEKKNMLNRIKAKKPKPIIVAGISNIIAFSKDFSKGSELV